ncbi:MAG: adenylyltransferase/cytidyltransferase family protein [Chloroflexi bacterium]|nr:adenylyltransferase/cytidyltransferase family protein [Chloroflexota bacterium]
MEIAVVSGSFDDLRSSDIRFLEEASKVGELHVYLWSDELAASFSGNPPRFTLDERWYLIQALRYVNQIHIVGQLSEPDHLPLKDVQSSFTWVVNEKDDHAKKRQFSATHGLKYLVVKQSILKDFPVEPKTIEASRFGHPKVIVTGCFDWFHSGHVRFFEEVSQRGDLYVVVGSDQNVRFLKGDGHPLFPQEERRYVVESVRYVTQALISSGTGWVDAEPEINKIKPDIYVVNEDGDKPEKRNFCAVRGIQYVVLERKPKDGLPKRQSVDLRGF